MKKITLSILMALTITNSANALEATKDFLDTSSMVTTGWVYAAGLYTEMTATLGFQTSFAASVSSLQVTARAINGLNREEVERAIEREDQDTLDSIRDLIRYELEEAGEISSGDELSNEEVDILLYVILTK
ncbi:hypothetical protein ACRXCV_11080 [Halobacteriovorax sp. GFR7]|uniref:hypothetical protein n=1 Tax=unclassified Halobacteriovorax TaxID=2639665 RepID=UPI003D98EB70